MLLDGKVIEKSMSVRAVANEGQADAGLAFVISSSIFNIK
jgi:hypothetical protein